MPAPGILRHIDVSQYITWKNMKSWIGRASVRVDQAVSDISSISTQQQNYQFSVGQFCLMLGVLRHFQMYVEWILQSIVFSKKRAKDLVSWHMVQTGRSLIEVRLGSDFATSYLAFHYPGQLRARRVPIYVKQSLKWFHHKR